MLARLLGPLHCEVLLIVYLAGDGRSLGHVILGNGEVDAIAGRYRMLIEPALKLGARGFIMAHNHPSGDARPSAADIRVTRGLLGLARALDLAFADHLVVGGGLVTSMRRCGLVDLSVRRRTAAAGGAVGVGQREAA